MDEGKLLFSEIKFIITQCDSAQEIKTLLIDGGAKHINYLSDDVTHVIADTTCPKAEEAEELFDKPVVNSLWVHLSLKAKRLLPTQAFSPFKSVFKDVITSFSSNLSTNDIDILAATLTYHGGRVSKDIASATHFITPTTDSSDLPKDFPLNSQIKIVGPDWVLDSANQSCRCVEQLYEPSLLLLPPPTPPPPPPPPPPAPAPTQLPRPQAQPLQSKLPQPQPQPPRPQPPKPQSQPRLKPPTPSSQPSIISQQHTQQPQPRTQHQQIQLHPQLRPQQQQPRPLFYPQQQELHPISEIPKGPPLAGCIFKFIDYEHVNPKTKENWLQGIEIAGGSFDDNLEKLTHLICENRLSTTYLEASKLGVRCVTIYWVNDVLAQDRLAYPWKALHLPLSFAKDNQPLTDQIIAVTNLKGKERREVKEMILKTGARFTDYFSPSNTLLICGNVGGEKYERAVEWKIPIANCHILNDLLINSSRELTVMLAQSKYQLFNRGDPLKLTSYAEVGELMNPWTKPITVGKAKEPEKLSLINGVSKSSTITLNSNDDSGIATSGSNNSDFDTNNGQRPDPIAPSTKSVNGGPSLECEPASDGSLDNKCKTSLDTSDVPMDVDIDDSKKPTDSQETSGNPDAPNQHSLPIRKSNEPVRLLFTHLDPSLIEQLKSYASKLGLGLASSSLNCTHLIVDRISRTPKFICAFSHASFILSYKWIVESHEANNLLDEKHFILQDKIGEEKYSFNLVYSLLKRKKRAGLLFNNLIFFVTPSVLSCVTNLKEMIESAGGIMTTRKLPTKSQIDRLKADGKCFVAVTCEEDFHLCFTLESYGIDIVNFEFVISGILRQDVDFESHRLKAQSSPPKKLRLEDSSSC